MSKIKVGEYVRTKYGQIGKVKRMEEKLVTSPAILYGGYVGKFIYTENSIVEDREIVKCSKDIMDLIEEGDMLNKNEVIEVKGMGLCIYNINNKNWLPIGNIDYQMGIELAIVTHEQMEGVEYKVNE